ncbi:MAG TPA: hypothetical protein VFU08_01905 [Candidatus Udaeobacter sp.]|jgi:hypothetical protein|nr:hypothetical protein [Candidatus Udaeobacter sp.]
MSAKDSKQSTLHLLLDLLEKVEKIAAKNDLAVVDVIRLGLAWALPQIAKRGLLIKPG